MKITSTLISIPPYISTSWEQVIAIHMQGQELIFSLKDGETISVPSLSQEAIDQIFSAHTAFLESHPPQNKPAKPTFEQIFAFPLRMSLGALETMGQALQHNPAYSGLPPIPEEVVAKIASLAKMMGEEELEALPEPEMNCNCMYCQVVRALRKEIQKTEELADHPNLREEEKVADEELHFEQWSVTLIQDKMYKVTNKLDPKEQFTVHLGDPLGCTCGKPNCDHIIAVLRS